MNNTYDLILGDSKGFKDYFLNEDKEPITYLPKINSINIIVGANNSGKSRFIRTLMSFNSFTGIRDLPFLKKEILYYNLNVSETNSLIDEKYVAYKKRSTTIIYSRGNNSDQQDAKTLIDNKLQELELNDYDSILSLIKSNKRKLSSLGRFSISNIIISNYSNVTDDFIKGFNDFKKYYIPTLRTAHSLFKFDDKNYKKIENDVFLETLNNYYGLNNIEVEVFTGIHLYKEILNSRNSKREVRKLFENFEKFISKNFFGGKQIDIVAEFDKDESLKGNNHLENISVHIEGEKETRKIYDLGDGIQAIIILMYKIFMAEDKSFIFIDEPEINLHPGMQRLFLEQICSNEDLRKKNLTYIITTHSNHFLDLTIEKDNVSIYSFTPKNTEEKQFVIKNVNRGDNEILKNLGVNNSSVFMANCSIWVEGISDRYYIKSFLKSYCEYLFNNDRKNYINLKEDIDFAFFEYAGSNIDHYIFKDKIEKGDEEIVIKDIKALAISNRIFLLADSDASKLSTSKGKRLKSLEAAATDNFVPKIIWNLREVENLLTNDIWKEILIDLCNKKLVKTNKDEILDKIIEALEQINSLDFSKNYIGEFLESLRNKMGKISSTYILNQSAYESKPDSFGTIINKRELSESVFNKNFSWEILSKNKEIENLTIDIYNFITKRF